MSGSLVGVGDVAVAGVAVGFAEGGLLSSPGDREAGQAPEDPPVPCGCSSLVDAESGKAVVEHRNRDLTDARLRRPATCTHVCAAAEGEMAACHPGDVVLIRVVEGSLVTVGTRQEQADRRPLRDPAA